MIRVYVMKLRYDLWFGVNPNKYYTIGKYIFELFNFF